MGRFLDDLGELIGDVLRTVCDVIGLLGSEKWKDCWERFGDTLRSLSIGFFHSIQYFGLIEHRIKKSNLNHRVPSVMQREAECFNNALHKNDSISFSEEGIKIESKDQFGYTHGGTHTSFRLNENRVEVRIGNSGWHPLRGAVNYFGESTRPANGDAVSYMKIRGKGRAEKNSRNFEMYEAPEFDMIASDGNRIFAKEKGNDNFYFNTMVHEYPAFVKVDIPEGLNIDGNVDVPGFYSKLDPEYNQKYVNDDDDVWWRPDEFNDHPSIKPLLGVADGISDASDVAKSLLSNIDIMIVAVEPMVWHLIDSRPPLGSGKPPRGLKTYDHVIYKDFGKGILRLGILAKIRNILHLGTHQKSIRFYKVLSLGVGNMHRHTHYTEINGGEMEAGPDTGIAEPTIDRAGFWDGICNFFILVQLRSDKWMRRKRHTRRAYGILWIDEQSYFSERWRLVHPDDNLFSLFRDWALLGVVRSLLPWLRIKYRFNKKKFWCPFKAGGIDDRSRLAVSRQTLVVTGRKEIYSINFSWGTMDRTWRWRKYPEDVSVCYLSDNDVENGCQTITIDEKCPDSIYPQTISLREDMTICMKGTHKTGETIKKGRWFQKYLPADNLEVPLDLTSNTKPKEGYSHPWRFITEDNHAIAKSFSQFGAYEEIDTRNQYYTVEFPDDVSALAIENSLWCDYSEALTVTEPVLKQKKQAPWPFTNKLHFRFLKGNGDDSGFIMTFSDKRNDDLLPFDQINETVTLMKFHSGNFNQTLNIRLKANIQVWHPPVVNHARITVDHDSQWLTFEFKSCMYKAPRIERDRNPDQHWSAKSDISTIREMAVYAIEEDSTGEHRVPGKVLTIPIQSFIEDPDNRFWYIHQIKYENQEAFAHVARYFSENGRSDFATSVIFKGILGHVAMPETIEIANKISGK